MVERLLKNPTMDPKIERMHKRAAESVQKSKRKIEDSVAKVEEMAVLADKLSGAAAERAAKARKGCLDSHPGICTGVRIQGHCGIKAYAKACPMSCHRCAMDPSFIMGSPSEKRRKAEVEKAGKVAAKKKAKAEE